MLIHLEVTAILNMYVASNRDTQYVKHKLIELKEETQISTTIVGEFNIPI